MEDIRALTKILSEIKKLSDTIIFEALPIMKSVESLESEMVKNLADSVSCSSEHALDVLQTITLDWIKDAEPLKTEVSSFIIKDEDSFRLNTEGCPVLAEVWGGDAYDKPDIDGLKELRSDLQKTLENISEEKLYKEAFAVLTGEDPEQ